jgi:hypothetical protein
VLGTLPDGDEAVAEAERSIVEVLAGSLAARQATAPLARVES